MPAFLLILLIALTAATANVAAFEMRAHDLEQRLAADQAAGVPASSLAEARRELAAEEARRAGLLPAAVVSGAAVADPFAVPEASTATAYGSALTAARHRATAALGRRQDAGGPNDQGLALRLVQLARVSRPVDADVLTRRWNAEAAGLEATRQQLAGESGGLVGGLPADVVAATTYLTDLASRADATGIAITEASAALMRSQSYLRRLYQGLLADHQVVMTDLRSTTALLQGRVDERAQVDDILARDGDVLKQVSRYGPAGDFQSRLDHTRAAVDAATSNRDQTALESALAEARKVDADLQAAAGGRLPTSGIPCQAGAPAQLIVIHLAAQQLVAYQDGCPFLRTPVTTGRVELPTGRGTFHVYYKAATYHMISPWPLGSPFYYPPTWVSNVMEFIGNGTFIHSADWEPANEYGPGSQFGAYASHGCVHVLDGPLQQLYDWAAIGTTVVVDD